jgi:hypothetical protein
MAFPNASLSHWTDVSNVSLVQVKGVKHGHTIILINYLLMKGEAKSPKMKPITEN